MQPLTAICSEEIYNIIEHHNSPITITYTQNFGNPIKVTCYVANSHNDTFFNW